MQWTITAQIVRGSFALFPKIVMLFAHLKMEISFFICFDCGFNHKQIQSARSLILCVDVLTLRSFAIALTVRNVKTADAVFTISVVNILLIFNAKTRISFIPESILE